MTDFILLALVFTGLGLYLIGLSLINAYFKRKERFVEALNNKLRSSQDATTE